MAGDSSKLIDALINAKLKERGGSTPKGSSKIIRETPRPQTGPGKFMAKAAKAQEKAAKEEEKLAKISERRKKETFGNRELVPLHQENSDAGQRAKDITSTRIILALFLAVAYDVADGFLSFLGISEIIELPINIAFQFLMMKMLGGYFNKLSWVELVPFVDIFPFYTISVYMSYRQYKEDHETDETRKGFIHRKRERTKQRNEKIKIFLNKRGKKGTLIIGAIIMIILVVGAGLLFSGDAGAKMAGDVVRRGIKYIAEEEYWQTLNNFGGMFKGMIDWIRGQFDRQVEIATTGDIFNGKVDEYATQKLGLNLKVDDQRVASEDRQPLIKDNGIVKNAFITGEVSGRGLDEGICEAVNVECDLDQISLSCFTNRNEKGTMTHPKLDFKYLADQFLGISCNFAKLEVGEDKSRTIFMKAEFDFIAAGSIIKQMVSKDKFDELYKTDHKFRTGKARYTPGPVSTKILDTFATKNVLIAAPEIPVRFGVEFENVGEGQIDHFEKITIMVPDGVEIRACNPPMDGTNPITLDYEKDQSDLKATRNRNMGAGKRMKIICDLIINEEALYITDEITLEFFQVLAEYKYKIQEGVKFGIQEFAQIIPIYDDDIILCEAETCECKIRSTDESTKTLAKGQNCGETHKQIALDCKEKEKSSCESSQNQCKWINDRYGCRIKTFSVS